jgi:hypothetical protein
MAKKKKKAKSKVKRRKRGHGKSTAKRASTAKRGAKRVTLTVAQLRALTKGKKGAKRKKSSSGRYGKTYTEKKRDRFAVGATAAERKLEASVRREEAKLDAAVEKRRKEDEREAAKAKKEREEEEKFAKSRAELATLRADRERRSARREAEWENKIADHKARVAAAREELRAEASSSGSYDPFAKSPSIGGSTRFSYGRTA